MRLNGIHAEPRTLIGLSKRHGFLIVVSEDDAGVVVRKAREDEIQPRYAEPRSIAEHRALPRRVTPYGLVRQFTPSPHKAPEVPQTVLTREAKKKLRKDLRRAVEKGRINRIIVTGR